VCAKRGPLKIPTRAGRLGDAKHAEFVSAFHRVAIRRRGYVDAPLPATRRERWRRGGAALNVIEGAERVAAFLAGVARKGWTDDLTVRFDTINGLPGLIVSGPNGLVQTSAFEIEGDVVKAIYVVRNPDKLRHLATF
jgi:RNA polymerase sigma-70 factor (ECF subfamily)